jgi:two-component system chemotaxis sensor kinase CheA
MPLVPVSAATHVRTEGTQPVLVFIDQERSMGLVVDEIVDIVDDRLDIRVGSDNPGILGSAIVNGKVTEILDVGHYLPLAFEDWLHRAEVPQETFLRRVLLIDDSAFFLNMLTPVLKAAGYSVRTATAATEALATLERDTAFDFVISDIEMPGLNGFEFAERVRADPHTAHLRLVALTSLLSPALIERGRDAGFTEFVAKFDRGGLLALLRTPPGGLARAA